MEIMSIEQATIREDSKGYCSISFATLETVDSLRELAEDLWTDKLYQDAQWYDARSTEMNKKAKFIAHGSSGNLGFYWQDLPQKAQKRYHDIIMRETTEQSRKRRKAILKDGFSFSYCNY